MRKSFNDPKVEDRDATSCVSSLPWESRKVTRVDDRKIDMSGASKPFSPRKVPSHRLGSPGALALGSSRISTTRVFAGSVTGCMLNCTLPSMKICQLTKVIGSPKRYATRCCMINPIYQLWVFISIRVGMAEKTRIRSRRTMPLRPIIRPSQLRRPSRCWHPAHKRLGYCAYGQDCSGAGHACLLTHTQCRLCLDQSHVDPVVVPGSAGLGYPDN